jgi:predicted O-methyltransferase YrrM
MDVSRDLFGTSFCGVRMLQQWVDLALWERVFEQHPGLRCVVELGTFEGGMSLFLLAQCRQRGIGFVTVDRRRPDAAYGRLGQALGLDAHTWAGDIWGGDAQALLKGVLEDNNAHPLLLYCDNGDKRREFAHFLPLLRQGDLIAVHDWGTEFGPDDALPHMARLEPVLAHEAMVLDAITRFWRVL